MALDADGRFTFLSGGGRQTDAETPIFALGKTLAEARPKQLFVEMNVLWLKPTHAPLVAAAEAGAYDCPVYRTTARGAAAAGGGSEFICHVRLPSEGAGEAHWIRRSAALICSLDE